MNTAAKAAAAAAVILVAAAAVGAAYVFGVGPLEEDPAAGLDDPETQGEVVDLDEDTDDGQDGDDEDGDGEDAPPYAFEIQEITECGETCRDVDVALHNQMEEDATDVVVYTRIYAGDSTSDDDVVWADNRDVGTLEAGDTLESTDRVELTVQQANNVREEDGLITLETTVESTQATVTFVREENVM